MDVSMAEAAAAAIAIGESVDDCIFVCCCRELQTAIELESEQTPAGIKYQKELEPNPTSPGYLVTCNCNARFSTKVCCSKAACSPKGVSLKCSLLAQRCIAQMEVLSHETCSSSVMCRCYMPGISIPGTAASAKTLERKPSLRMSAFKRTTKIMAFTPKEGIQMNN